MDNQIEEKQIACLINCYYFLIEAGDMILREAERKFNAMGRGLNHDVKHRHTMLMREVARCKDICENFFGDYDRAFGTNIASRYEDLRATASYFAKVALLISDRCCDSDNWQKERLIAEFIGNMPEHGYISEETIKNLTIK